MKYLMGYMFSKILSICPKFRFNRESVFYKGTPRPALPSALPRSPSGATNSSVCSGRAGKLMRGQSPVRKSPPGSVREAAAASPLHLVVSAWEHGTRVARYCQFSRVFGNLRTESICYLQIYKCI